MGGYATHLPELKPNCIHKCSLWLQAQSTQLMSTKAPAFGGGGVPLNVFIYQCIVYDASETRMGMAEDFPGSLTCQASKILLSCPPYCHSGYFFLLVSSYSSCQRDCKRIDVQK